MKTENNAASAKPAPDNHYEHKTDLHDAAPAEVEAPQTHSPGALTPESFTGIRTGEVSHAAGGVPAARFSSAEHYGRRAGSLKRRFDQSARPMRLRRPPAPA